MDRQPTRALLAVEQWESSLLLAAILFPVL